ncbi:MAG TPA: alpha/beta hydrolase, partial [Burkholderiales bacterium]|nr:alpha/beta hydrolase [Burkholderiales bacterium]
LLERKNGPSLYYELDDFTDPWRDAPYIMLQHGYARSTKFWRAWVPYLSRFYKVIRMDLRGLGQSSKDFDLTTGFSAKNLLQDFNDLLDHLKVDSAHYCGESSAGTLGLAFAAECPQRVRSLTVISSPVAMSEEDKVSSLGQYSNRIDALRKGGARGWLEASNAGRRFPADADPALLAWTLDEMSKSDTEVLVEMFKFVSNVDTAPMLPKIAAPVLAIYPKAGVITKDEHTEALKQKIGNLKMVRVPLQAHSLQIVAPALCASEVLYFISQHDGIVCREQ